MDSSAAAAADGRVVVTWESDSQDGSGLGVFGRRSPLDVIFAEGFQAS